MSRRYHEDTEPCGCVVTTDRATLRQEYTDRCEAHQQAHLDALAEHRRQRHDFEFAFEPTGVTT